MSFSNPRVALAALCTLSAALFGCGAEVAVEPDDTPAPAFAKGKKCQVGETQCKGSCFDLQTDPLNCGACGNVCGVTELCVAGACVANCPAATCSDVGLTDCGGRCVDLTSDDENCGGCGNRCTVSGRVCVLGSCEIRCPSGQLVCGGMAFSWVFSRRRTGEHRRWLHGVSEPGRAGLAVSSRSASSPGARRCSSSAPSPPTRRRARGAAA